MGTHRRQSSGRSPRPGRQRAPLALQLPALEAGMSPGQPPGCHPGRFRWCGPADCRAAGAALQRRQQTKIAPRVASVGVLPVEQQRIESPKRRSSRCSAGLSAQPARDASSGACGTKVPPKMQYGSLLTCDASESETRIRSHPTPLTFGRKVTTVAAPPVFSSNTSLGSSCDSATAKKGSPPANTSARSPAKKTHPVGIALGEPSKM
mmetsp:Transcript_144865/g.464329  ORF Transcript_144865/g.464329 Transcript_144865/m.464329 type:complete len:207 (-) Transcript_144865:55-675(-)